MVLSASRVPTRRDVAGAVLTKRVLDGMIGQAIDRGAGGSKESDPMKASVSAGLG